MRKKRVNRWSFMTPHAKMVFGGPNLEEFSKNLSLIPGLKQDGGSWLVPLNAVNLVADAAELYAVTPLHVEWVIPPKRGGKWEEVREELLAGGVVREEYLSGWLKDYQEDAISWGWSKTGAHYWLATGSGKTIIGLFVMLSVEGPLLIVTRTAAKLQFGREVRRFTHLRPHIMRPAGSLRRTRRVNGRTWGEFFSEKMVGLGSASLVAEAWKVEKEAHGVEIEVHGTLEGYLRECKEKGRRPVVIVGWEALTVNKDRLMKLQPTGILVDESHNLGSSKRWDVIPLPDLPTNNSKALYAQLKEEKKKAGSLGGFIKTTEDGRIMFVPYVSAASTMAEIMRLKSIQKRVATTATAIRDRVRGLFSPLDLIEPNAWGATTLWMTRYANRRPGRYGGWDTTGTSNIPELRARLDPVRFSLSYHTTHSKLPPKRRQSFYVAAEDQCKPAAGFIKEIREASKRGPTAVLEARLAESASRKRKAVLSLVEDHIRSGQKVAIFTGRRRDCDDLAKKVRAIKYLKKEEVQVWSAHGGQSDKVRDTIAQDFRSWEDPCVLISTGHSMGESLNLDDADAVLFVMLPYSPGQLRQWEGRFHRASTKKAVLIYFVIAEGTVDEHVASILIDKLPAVEEVAQDSELAAAGVVLAGIDMGESEEDFAAAVLDAMDWG
jgi:superfamily II DNA or RNA helicase